VVSSSRFERQPRIDDLDDVGANDVAVERVGALPAGEVDHRDDGMSTVREAMGRCC
jgi:hypothetical protein